MASVLEEILSHKKVEVDRRRRQVRPAELFRRLEGQSGAASFRQALGHADRVDVIAEIKKASPSAGVIREAFDPIAIATTYEAKGASAISVLTDRAFFQGDIEFVRQVREAVTLPILRKDFILDPYQILEARAYGADAVLLILAALSDAQCQELAAAATELGLDVLAEVHNFRELECALIHEFKLIGINNRDLKTFVVDLRTTEKLLADLPADVLVVSESGLKRRADVERLARLGVDAVLIGESLMRQKDVGGALAEFVGVPRWSR